MTKAEEYAIYLQSDHWRDLRLRAKAVHGNRCACCTDEPIQMHHLRYGTWFDVTANDLIPLCDGCHELAHSIKAAYRLIYSDRASEEKRLRLLGILRESRGLIAPIRNPIPKARKKQDRRQLRRRVEEKLGLLPKHSGSISRENMCRILNDPGFIPRNIQRILSSKYGKKPTRTQMPVWKPKQPKTKKPPIKIIRFADLLRPGLPIRCTDDWQGIRPSSL